MMIDSCARRASSCVPPGPASWVEETQRRWDFRFRAKHLVRGPVVANRVRLTAVTALAMLNVFALGAGAAVAVLLPPRLALWQVPRVAAARIAAPAAVLTPAVPAGALPTSRGLASELAPLMASRSLGPSVGVVVTDLASGKVLFARSAGTPATPASSAKVA